jgi:Ser/Thr protein kinase RdoA (MazF antagonist)
MAQAAAERTVSVAAETVVELRDVLSSYGLADAEVHDIRSGRRNKHWRAVAGYGKAYALRRYAAERTRPAIAYEHAALTCAGERGWPVAVPLANAHEDRLVGRDGRLYALFPFLTGRPAPYSNARYLRIKGALLARLHRDLASAPVGGQRVGFSRVWEVDGDDATYQELLREFARDHREGAAVLRRDRYSSLRELSRLGYGELDDIVVHWDFHHDNLLFGGGTLTGLLDFDSVHRDARVADIAQSILLDCLEPPAHNAIRAESLGAFVAGYHASSPLADIEAQLLVPLLFALVIARSAESLRAWLRSGNRRALASLERATRFRLPVMQAQRMELQATVRAVIG